MFTYCENTFSDLHKDTYGFRPRGHEFYDTETTPARKQEIWDSLCDAFDREQERQAAYEAGMIAAYERTLEELMELGATDRETAKRWYLDSLNLSDMDIRYGADYICYELGMPYSMKVEFEAYVAEKRSQIEEW